MVDDQARQAREALLESITAAAKAQEQQGSATLHELAEAYALVIGSKEPQSATTTGF